MADIIAAPVAPQVYIWAGGIFDALIVGLPVYFWIMFLEVLLLGGIIFWNWYGWSLMAPVVGYYDAIRKNIPQAIKITKNMRMKLVPAKYADQIFEWEDPQEIEKWHLTSPHSVGQLGSVNTAILIDYHDIVDNPIYNESIKIAAEMWNELYPDDQIHHYDKYMQYRSNGKLKSAINELNKEWYKKPENDGEPSPILDAIRVPAYFWVDFGAQETYMPPQSDASGFGGWMIHESADYKTPENEEKKNYGVWILGASIIVSILILAFSFMMGQKMMGG